MTKPSFFLFIIILTLSLFSPQPVQALAQAQEDLFLHLGQESKLSSSIFALAQIIEILRYEIQLLKSLLLNFRLQQEITAASYLVMNLSDNSVMLAQNTNQSYPIASLTKLMTAVIALEHIEKNQTITLTEKMLKPLGYSPSLFLGLNISAENLLKASLIQSTNDASESLAYFLAKENFLNLMNQKAKELGMENTFFYDVHGLSPANRSNATDLAKLLAYIYKEHPEILEISRDNNFWLPDSTGRLLKFRNVNNFYPLSQFLGGKTGYLAEAKQALASVFLVEEKPVAIILLYSKNHQADTFNLLQQLRK